MLITTQLPTRGLAPTVGFALLLLGCGRVGFHVGADGDLGFADGSQPVDASRDGTTEPLDSGPGFSGLEVVDVWTLTNSSQTLPYAIAVDGDAVFVAGTFEAPVDLGGAVLPYRDRTDVFVARFDTAGNHQWSVGLGGSGSDDANDLYVDATAVHLHGHGQSGDYGRGMLTTRGGDDYLVLRLDRDTGETLRVTNLGSPGDDDGGGEITGDGTGRYWAALNFDMIADYLPIPFASVGDDDAIVVELDDSGVVDRFMVGTPGIDQAWAVDRSSDGATAYGGLVTGGFDFGLGRTAAGGDVDGFVVARDSSSVVRVAARYAGPGVDQVRSVRYASDGSLWVGGIFSGPTADLGGELSSGSAQDAFVQRRATDGSYTTTVIGGPGDESINEIVVDDRGWACAVGNHDDGASFGGGSVAAQLSDVFLACYSPSGERDVLTFGGPQDDHVGAVGTGSDGDLWVATHMTGPVQIDGEAVLAGGERGMVLVRVALR